jgi:hypothetical protein
MRTNIDLIGFPMRPIRLSRIFTNLVHGPRPLIFSASNPNSAIRWAATSFAPHDQLYAQNRSKSEGLNPGSGSLICWIWSLKSARSSAKLVAAQRITPGKHPEHLGNPTFAITVGCRLPPRPLSKQRSRTREWIVIEIDRCGVVYLPYHDAHGSELEHRMH